MPVSISQQVTEIAHALVATLRPYADRDGPQAHQSDDFVHGVQRAMQQALDALTATDYWGPDNRLASSEFWKIAGETLSPGVLQLHARQKPHGYAGDFEMLHMICSDVRHGSGLAWVYDDFFQQQAAPCAVRNRAALVAERLADDVQRRSSAAASSPSLRVVSVGSGPADDLARFAAAHPALATQVEVTLLDLDPRALQFAEDTIGRLFPPNAVQTRRVNLKRLPRLPEMSLLQGADFIFCSGFFDYLNQDEAAAMLSALWQALATGGQLLVFNFSKDNPSRAYMEWIGNWYLTYRSREEFLAVAALAELPDGQFAVDVEPAGVNLYLRASKDPR